VHKLKDMTKNKFLKTGLVIFGAAIIIGGGFVYYLFNMPHRDVQASSTDYKLAASEVVREYLNNAQQANEKYLDDEGESKILEISGTVASITEDFNKQKVVLFKNAGDKAGVSCTFTAETNASLEEVEIGDTITVKGVIRSGASYDEDLGMYEHVILEKCAIVPKQ
jgi:hypothetical protein